MSSNIPPLSPTPKRRVLHERSRSHSNQIPPAATLRLVLDQESDDETDVYSVTPFPTKPEHVLIPTSGNTKGLLLSPGRAVSDSTSGPTTSGRSSLDNVAPHSLPDHDDGNLSELSSTLHGANSSSAGWDDAPNSSRTTIPHAETPPSFEHQEQQVEAESTLGSDRTSEDSVIALPPTIKAVPPDSSIFGSPPPDASQAGSPSSETSSPNLFPTSVTSSPNFVALNSASSSPNIIPTGASSSPNLVALHSSSSSPNIIPTGVSSSPNFVALNSSSPNLVPVGSSSPTVVQVAHSDSSLYTSNSVGTARRYFRTALQNRASSADEPSDQASTPSGSFASSPPNPALRSYQSTSSFALPPARPSNPVLRSSQSVSSFAVSPRESWHGRSHTSSTSSQSTSSTTDAQSDLPVQYPTIRSPTASTSWANSADTSLIASPSSPQSMTDRTSGRWHPHLSTVPSEWSQERLQSIPSPSVGDEHTDGSWPRGGYKARTASRQSIWIVDESEIEESGDHLTHLRSPPPLRHKTSGTLSNRSSGSRLDSLRSLGRPGSSGSTFSSVIPGWARIYYRSGVPEHQLSPSYTPSLVESSRPSSPRDPRFISPNPLNLTRPRTRPYEPTHLEPTRPEPTRPVPPPLPIQSPNPSPVPAPLAVHPIDPRSHWIAEPEPEMQEITLYSTDEQLPSSWSPHLYHDKRSNPARRSRWKAPSLDESAESLFGRRNIQVYAFCLGFLFPLAWLIASFLPLPPNVTNLNEQATSQHVDHQHAFRSRVVLVEELRRENARWWRNLNRCMTPVGLSIIAVVITLSVLGTQNRL